MRLGHDLDRLLWRTLSSMSGHDPEIVIEAGATVAVDALLIGVYRILVESGAIVHPLSVIDSTYGPVSIKRGAIICERCMLCPQKDATDSTGADLLLSLVVGPDSIIEVGTILNGSSVGMGCKIGPAARMGAASSVGDGCIVGPMINIPPGKSVPDSTCLYLDDGGDDGTLRMTKYRFAPHMLKCTVRRYRTNPCSVMS